MSDEIDLSTARWRRIINDRGMEGIAPVCQRQVEPGGPHEWYEPGVAMLYDEQSVLQCCPWPQIETGYAQQMVDLLNNPPVVVRIQSAEDGWVRGFRLVYPNAPALDGAQFPSGHCILLEPGFGFMEVAISLGELTHVKNNPLVEVEWGPS